MTKARCLKCGLVINGRWKSGPPKSCPKCGYDKSEQDIKAMVKAQIERMKKPANASSPR